MKCYVCKGLFTTIHRVFMPAKDGRFKEMVRDVCDPCYCSHMKELGFSRVNGMWIRVVEPDPEFNSFVSEHFDELTGP